MGRDGVIVQVTQAGGRRLGKETQQKKYGESFGGSKMKVLMTTDGIY